MSIGSRFNTLRALWRLKRRDREERRLTTMSPEATQFVVRTLERQGMPVQLDLAVPGWRRDAVVAVSSRLAASEELVVPAQPCGLPEERHAWPALHARRLKGAVLDVDSGLVFAGDRVIAQSGTGTRASRDAAFVSGATVRVTRSHAPRAGIMRDATQPVAPLGDVHHHYHVLIETLPRLARIAAFAPETRIVTSAEIPERYQDLIASLGLVVEQMPSGAVLSGEIVLVDQPELFWPRPSDLRTVSDALASGERDTDPGEPRKRLYISRRAGSRSLEDEAELEERLQAEGFESVCLEQLPIEEQVRLFEGASVVVAPHGAGLSNIVFMTSGSRVIEITTGELYEQCYRRMSAALNLDHHVILIPGSTAEPFGRAAHSIPAVLAQLT